MCILYFVSIQLFIIIYTISEQKSTFKVDKNYFCISFFHIDTSKLNDKLLKINLILLWITLIFEACRYFICVTII